MTEPECDPYEGWETFDSSTVETIYHWETDNWESEMFSQAEESFTFTFKYPQTWTVRGTTFNDQSDEKIAELSPGGLFVDASVACFEGRPDEYTGAYGSLSLVDQSDITINNKSLTRRIELTTTDQSETYYSHQYCYKKTDKVVVLAFYDDSADVVEAFDKVAGSITVD